MKFDAQSELYHGNPAISIPYSIPRLSNRGSVSVHHRDHAVLEGDGLTGGDGDLVERTHDLLVVLIALNAFRSVFAVKIPQLNANFFTGDVSVRTVSKFIGASGALFFCALPPYSCKKRINIWKKGGLVDREDLGW